MTFTFDLSFECNLRYAHCAIEIMRRKNKMIPFGLLGPEFQNTFSMKTSLHSFKNDPRNSDSGRGDRTET